MLKAQIDFEYASVVVKAGDEIKPGVFEADQLQTLLWRGLIASDEKKHVEPAVKAVKGKSK